MKYFLIKFAEENNHLTLHNFDPKYISSVIRRDERAPSLHTISLCLRIFKIYVHLRLYSKNS